MHFIINSSLPLISFIINIIMNSKILKPQNVNKKKLIIIKDSTQPSQQILQKSLLKVCRHHQKDAQEQKRYEKKENMLPSIIPMHQSRISINLPQQQAKFKRTYSQPGTSKLFTNSKFKPSSFFSIARGPNLKIEVIVNAFIDDYLARNIFHLHFGKFLIQPKVLSQILLFVLNSINNSKNLNNFLRVVSDFSNFQQMIRELQRDQFSFKFAVRNNKKMTYQYQTVNERIQNQYRQKLEKEESMLNNKYQQLIQETLEKRNEKESLQKCINQYHAQINDLDNQMKRLNNLVSKENDTIISLRNAIIQNQKICEKLQTNKRHFSTSMANFNENRYNQVATRTRRLEEDLFQYVQYLNFHPLGKRNYEKSNYIVDLEKMHLNEMQECCKYITGQSVSPDLKVKAMQDFMHKTKDEYNTIINELLIVIREKTEFISNFTKLISKWHQNYMSKKSIIAELNRIISFEVLNLDEMKAFRQCGENYRYSKQVNTQKEAKITSIAQKILKVYQIALSFT